MNVLDVLLVILLVYVPNQLHFPADLGLKGFNILNILLFLTFIALLATGARAPSPAPLRWRFMAFAGALFVSFVIAQLRVPADIVQDLTVLKASATYLLLYFILYHGTKDWQRARRLIAVILFVAFVAALEAVREGFDYGFGHYNDGRRASGPFATNFTGANRAGVFYAAFLPMFFALLVLRRRSKLANLAGLAGTVMTTMAIFFTYSRQSYLTAAVVTLALAIKRNLLVGVLAVCLLASWTLWAPQAAVDRVQMTYVENASGEEQLDPSSAGRPVIWRQALEMLKQHPFGIGLNRFRSEIGEYGDKSNVDAHNGYVLVATETGPQGLLALLLVMVGLFGLGVRLIRLAPDEATRTLGYGYTAAVVSMMLGNLFGSTITSGEVMGNFWALSGVVARLTELEPEDAEDADPADA
jgi:O-antigen ligase